MHADETRIGETKLQLPDSKMRPFYLLIVPIVVVFAIFLSRRGGRTDGEAVPQSFAGWNARAENDLRALALDGNLAHLRAAEEAARRSLQIASASSNPGGLLMRARVEIASHRFAAARASAEELQTLLPHEDYPLQLLGTALFNLGDYTGAEHAWTQAEPGYGRESRLAQLDLVFGRTEEARERMRSALEFAKQSAIPAPESVAWCRVRLGEMAFRAGDWPGAEAEYAAALAILPGCFSALDHTAELRGAQGRIEEALEIYDRLIAQNPLPEIMQARGDLLAFAGKIAEARTWQKRAEQAYLASVARGEVLYFHHLAGLYADSLDEPEKAIEWAQRDRELRGGIQAWDALAWSFYKADRAGEARDAITKATATDTRDPHILYHAGMILMGAGDVATGRAALRAAAEANPRLGSFHVHR